MQPKLCTKCKKNIAVVFITKMENGATLNEGYCLKCARSLGIPQIDQAVKQMGFSEEDLETLSDEMSSMFGQIDQGDHDDDDMDSQTATFPLLNQLFGSAPNMPAKQPEPPKQENKEEGEDPGKKKKNKKHKFLDAYCMNLTARAREGKLDKVIGRDTETERVIQILNRRQKNNPCLIGEPGVGTGHSTVRDIGANPFRSFTVRIAAWSAFLMKNSPSAFPIWKTLNPVKAAKARLPRWKAS